MSTVGVTINANEMRFDLGTARPGLVALRFGEITALSAPKAPGQRLPVPVGWRFGEVSAAG